MQFNLLGPFEIITDDGRTLALGTPKMCQVIALLLMRPGSVVSVNALRRELWGDDAPGSAPTTLQTYIYHARKMFEREGVTSRGGPLLHTQSPGYRIVAEAGEVDANIFEQLVKQGRVLLDENRPHEARTALREAVGLWRGSMLANVTVGRDLREYVTHLEELKVRAIEMRIEAGEALGQQREMIPELRSLVSTYPLNEWFHARLINALNQSGRRAEAVHAYHDLRRTLRSELGLEPSPELHRLEHKILGTARPAAGLAVVDQTGGLKPRRRPLYRT
ncbi:AfsR/SARP family transcriptional regulator [Streptomyces microflavus]|uniref:AfsR/SARP family transcriptional regulator n=1 Tax=Streptomyces TaxID=1883 RepID=UPI000B917B13|nr:MULTISPECIES: AfsR/SARP family transcriptional regulator [Streptomyces]OXZ01545.1 hypothetical protein BEH93_30075 [Streptomyces sp. 2R]QTA30586.1 transcriptional regulator [Streptomyces sp. CA-256286]WSR89977.1 AfsR/SARP family transcriptional regulator [Streptomyces microflavus]WTF67971.1 AfsR/SARP family transcriptional regulator [Streptomyces microflavus]